MEGHSAQDKNQAIKLTSCIGHLSFGINISISAYDIDLISTLSLVTSSYSTLNPRENTWLTHLWFICVLQNNKYTEVWI